MKKNWYVSAEESISSGSVQGTDGEWHELGGEVSLGTYAADTEEEALDQAANDYPFIDRDGMIARELA